MEILQVLVGLGILVALGGWALGVEDSPRESGKGRGRWLQVLVVLWCGTTAWLAFRGDLTASKPGGLPPFLWGWIPAAAMFAATFLWRSLATWVEEFPSRSMVGLHVSRLATGLAMLHAVRLQGTVPAFAVPAGAGGILVGILAAAMTCRKLSNRRSAPLRLWNALGVADIVLSMVLGGIAGAGCLGGTGAGGPDLSGMFPLVLIPAFLVPLYLLTHFWIFLAARKASRAD